MEEEEDEEEENGEEVGMVLEDQKEDIVGTEREEKEGIHDMRIEELEDGGERPDTDSATGEQQEEETEEADEEEVKEGSSSEMVSEAATASNDDIDSMAEEAAPPDSSPDVAMTESHTESGLSSAEADGQEVGPDEVSLDDEGCPEDVAMEPEDIPAATAVNIPVVESSVGEVQDSERLDPSETSVTSEDLQKATSAEVTATDDDDDNDDDVATAPSRDEAVDTATAIEDVAAGFADENVATFPALSASENAGPAEALSSTNGTSATNGHVEKKVSGEAAEVNGSADASGTAEDSEAVPAGAEGPEQ